MSYKIISKTIALTLAIFTLFNSITVSIYATELNPKTDTITDILDVDSNENSGSAPYLGGGPSPSARVKLITLALFIYNIFNMYFS